MKKIISLIISLSLLLCALPSGVAFSENSTEPFFNLDFDNYTTKDQVQTEGHLQFNTADTAMCAIDSSIYAGNTGKSIRLYGGYTGWLYPKATDYNVFSVSYDIYFDTIKALSQSIRYSVDGARKDLNAWKLTDTGIISGGSATNAATPTIKEDTWYTFTYYFDMNNKTVSFFVDDTNVYTMANPSTTLTGFQFSISSSYTMNVYLDNITGIGGTNEFALATNTEATDSLSVSDIYSTCTANVTGFPDGAKIKFYTSDDGTTYNLYDTVSVSSPVLGIKSESDFYVKAELLGANGFILATSSPILVKGKDITSAETKIFGFKFDGLASTTWGTYCYRVKTNPGAAGAYNPTNSWNIDTSEAQLTTSTLLAINTNDGSHNECAIFAPTTSTSAIMNNIMGTVGYSVTQYNESAGNTYAEKMPPTYAVIKGSFLFKDFMSTRRLLIPMCKTVDNTNVTVGYLRVEKNGNLVSAGGKKEEILKALSTDVWYDIENIVDIKNRKGYFFVNGEYVGSTDYNTSANLISMYRVQIQSDKTANENDSAKMYFDDYELYSLSFDDFEIKTAEYRIDGTIADKVTDGDLFATVSASNNGDSKNIIAVHAVYSGDNTKKLETVKIAPISFVSGELYKTSTTEIGALKSGNTVKTMYFDVNSLLCPLKTADALN